MLHWLHFSEAATDKSDDDSFDRTSAVHTALAVRAVIYIFIRCPYDFISSEF